MGRLLVVPVGVQAHAAIEEHALDTHVEVAVFLPREILVLKAGDDGALVAGVGKLQVVERLPGIVGAHVVVALLAVAGLHAQVVDPPHVFQEALARDAPVGAHRPEGARVVVFVEARRGILAQRGREVVAVVVVVVQAAQPRVDAVVILVGVGAVERGARAQLEDAVDQVGLAGLQVVVLVVVELVAQQHVDVVHAAQGAGPREQLVEGVGLRAAVDLVEQAAGLGLVAVLGVEIAQALGVVVVEAEVHREFQALCPAILGQVAAEYHACAQAGHVVVDLGLVEQQAAQRAEVVERAGTAALAPVELGIAVGADHRLALGVLEVDGKQRVDKLGREPHVAVGRAVIVAEVLRGPGQRGVEAGLEPVGDLAVGVHTRVVALEAGGLQYTVLVEVAQRHEVVRLL